MPVVDRWLTQVGGADLRKLATDTTSGEADRWVRPSVDRSTLAMLQFTSGAIGAAKGVMIDHGNMLHNSAYLERTMRLSPTSVVLSWLPLFHDMGLFGSVVQPMYMGCPCFQMSPLAFLQRPVRWLQAISRLSATHSGGPNFAYELCIHRTTPEQRLALDLSSWEVAFNGAEPIQRRGDAGDVHLHFVRNLFLMALGRQVMGACLTP